MNAKQRKALKKGKFPKKPWNYGINLLLGYRIPKQTTSKRAITNSEPNPIKE